MRLWFAAGLRDHGGFDAWQVTAASLSCSRARESFPVDPNVPQHRCSKLPPGATWWLCLAAGLQVHWPCRPQHAPASGAVNGAVRDFCWWGQGFQQAAEVRVGWWLLCCLGAAWACVRKRWMESLRVDVLPKVLVCGPQWRDWVMWPWVWRQAQSHEAKKGRRAGRPRERVWPS